MLREIYPRKSGAGIHWIGDFVDIRVGRDAVAKRKIFATVRLSTGTL
jgi:hypothetical protein